MIPIRLQPQPDINEPSGPWPSTCRTNPADLDPRLRLRVSGLPAPPANFHIGFTDLVVVGVVVGPSRLRPNSRKPVPYPSKRERRDRFPDLWQDVEGTVRRGCCRYWQRGLGTMARNEQDMLDILGRVTAETREKQQEAADEGRWREAFELLASILIWRAIAQAIRLGIVPHMFDVTANAFDLGKGLRSKCARALESMTIDEAPTSKFQKARTLSLVLDGIVDTVGVLNAWTGGDPQEPFFLGVRAIALGQAEAGLELMEEGHWEDVARWRDRQVGRPKGYQQAWRVKAAPVIQEWRSRT